MKKMSLNFFKNFGIVKAQQLVDGAVNLAVTLDTDVALETAIKQKQEEHALVVKQLIEDTEYLKQQTKELNDIEILYKQRLAAAEAAKADYIADANNTEARDALMELLNGIESMLPQLEKEKADVVEATQMVDETRVAAQEVAAELSTMRESIEAVKRSIVQAERDNERAEKELDRQNRLVGLKGASSKFNTATAALQAKADKLSKEASVTKTVAEQLKSCKATDSSAVSKYLNQATVPVSAETLEERMAKLLK